MELELGLKITKTRDGITSISEYRLAKDRAGPLFQSRETNTMFILTAHLKGYKSNNIVIKINEDGSMISISGEKPIQEMLMVGWVMLKKEVEITGFSKVFKIPDGVILDRIKAKYDEDEWILKIVMPKLVKGICGARIEEVKEDEYDRGRSELEKSEADQIVKSVGETSQKRSKDSEVQEMEDRESVMGKKQGGLYEQMLDDANGDIVGETIKREIEESKLGIEDGESVRHKVGEEEYVAMKTLELEQNVGASIQKNIGDTSPYKDFKVQEMEDSESVVEKKERVASDKMIDDANRNIIGDTIRKNKEGSKLGIEDGMVESVSQKVGMEGYEVMKKSELEQNVGASIPQKNGDTSQNKESKVQKMKDSESVVENKEGGISDKMLDGANREIIGETIQKQVEGPKFGIEDRNGEKVKEKVGKEGYEVMKTSELEKNVGISISLKIGDTSQDKEAGVHKMEDNESVEKEGGVSDKMLDEASRNIIGETIQKDIEGSKLGIEGGMVESVKEKVGKAAYEAGKKSEIEQNVGTCIPQIIGDTSQDKESEVLQMEDKGSIVEKEKMVTNKMLDDASRNIREMIQNDIEESKLGIEDGDEESVREKDGKVGCKVMKISELDQNVADHIPSNIDGISQEVSKEFEIQQMEKTGNVEGKIEGGEPKKMPIEAIPKNIFEETIPKDIEKPKFEIENGDQEYVREKARDGPNVSGNIVKGVLGTAQEKLPKQVVETLETMPQDENDKSEHGIVKLKGEGSIKMHVEANEVLEEDTTGDGIEKEIREPKLKSSDQLSGQQDVHDGGFDGSKRPKFTLMGETEGVKEEGAKIEQSVMKVNGEKFEKIQMEANGSFTKDITRETTWKETEGPKVKTKEKDQQHFQQEISKGIFEASNAAKEEFPMEMVDSLDNKRKGLKDTKIEEAKEVKEELIKQKRERKMEETEDVKNEVAEIEQFEKKVKGEKYEKIQLEANGGLVKDITRETTPKETKEPKIQTKVKDQLCLQEEMSKGRFGASTTAREFLIEDSLAKKRKGPKDKEIEEAEEVGKRKIDETKVVESTTKEKIQESKNERITQTLQEVPEEKHPKSLETGTPERELQSAEGPTTCEKVESMGFREVEQGNAKDKTQKTVLLPPKNQSKQAYESKDDSVKQGILKPKKAKEVGEGETCTYNIEITKAVASIEDQVAKPLSEPWFPSAQQSEVEQKGKLHEGCEAKYKASQREDPTKDLHNSIEMKDSQEFKQMETLKPEIPLEGHLKKGAQVTRQDEFYKGQEDKKTMQEKTVEPKNKIDDRDQQNVHRDVGKGVGIVETTGKEMPEEEYVADVGPIARRIKTKRDLEAALEREKYISTQNVNDEKPRARVKEELREADIENVDKAKCIAESQEKGHTRKLEVVEKEEQPMEAISSLPGVTSMGFKEVGPKKEIEEVPRKELSPITVEMKSKEPLKLEKQIMEWKFPKTKEYISTDTKQYGYITEDVKEPKIAACQGGKSSKLESPTLTQQSIDEENRKLENVVEEHGESKESPKKNTNIDLQESNERMANIENEEMETLQPHILESQCFAEKQKVDGKEEEAGQCGFQDIYEEETKAPKILIVEENNDKNGYQMTKDVEDELLKQGHKAEIVFERREGPKVAKSEETKEASKQLLNRETGKITQTAKVKKPKMKGITLEFEQVAEKMHETQRESEEVTSKLGVEITPNKGIEKSQIEEISPLPMEIQSKEPHELSWPSIEHEIPKIEGMTESQAVADKVTKPSKISTSSSTQPFEDKENDKIAANHEQKENPQPESSPTDQQSINKDQEESHGMHQIEEEKANEQDSQVLEEPKEEASGGGKDGRKRSNKLLVPLVMAGSALLVSFIVIFVRHRRARKSVNIDPNEGFIKNGQSPLLSAMSAGHALHVFINGQLSGTVYRGLEFPKLTFSGSLQLRIGNNKIYLRSVAVGLPNGDVHFETWNAEVLGPVTLAALNEGTRDLSQQKWSYKIGLKGETLNLHTVSGSTSVE